VLTTIAFSRVSRPAGWLFLPYLLWLGYAGALNFAIWRLNS
jgi:tryptophan-rich sensory protein